MTIHALGPYLQNLYADIQSDMTGFAYASVGYRCHVGSDGYDYVAVPSGSGTPSGITYLTGTGVDWSQTGGTGTSGGSGVLPTLGNEQVIIGSGSGNVLRQLTQDDILPGFAITGFSLAGTNYAAVVEVGTTISSISATATYQSGPAIVPTGITDTTSGVWTFLTPFASGTRAGSVQKTANNDTWVATLSATGPSGVVKTAGVTVTWSPKIYHGPSTVPGGGYNAAFITGLATSVLLPSRACSFTDVMGVNQYDYFALPSSYGTPIFTFGVLSGGFSLVASSVSVTSNGVTMNYDLWKSNQPNLGSTLWTVT
jgi:hypothetical protein